IGCGHNSSFGDFSDFWEYSPDSTTAVEEFTIYNLQCTIAPNPARDFISINIPHDSYPDGKEKISLTITDVQGNIVETDNYPSLQGEIKINIHNFSNGIYFVELNNGKEKAVKKFVKE
ncbi:MAG: T9SS type A sorting domain-containing protein, partial [Bacteroidota bacterium]